VVDQVETKILGDVQDLPKGVARENKIIQTVMRQLLFSLDGLHSTGIVHRDIKSQNIIFSEGSNELLFYLKSHFIII
jgi:serine/threonine protein kinase